MEDFVGRFMAELGAGVEHLHGILLDADAGDSGEASGDRLVERRAGRRAEHQRIREDRRAQESRDLRFDLHLVLVIHHGHDGRGAAERLIAEVDRAHGLDRIDAVVVDDLHHLGGADAVHGLTLFVMVDEDHPAALGGEQVALGQQPHIAVVAVENREIADAQLAHGGADVRHEIVGAEGDEAVFAHDMGDRHGLIYQLGAGIEIHRRHDDGAAGFFGALLHRGGHLRAVADHQTSRAVIEREALQLGAAADDHQIILGDIVLHDRGACGGCHHLAAGEMRLLISRDDLAPQRLGDIQVRGRCLGQRAGVLILHIEAGDVPEGDDAADLAALREHRDGLDILVAHMLPCTAQRNMRIDALDAAKLDVRDHRLQRFNELGFLDAEVLENEFRFVIDLTRAAWDVFLAGELLLERGVTDRGADRVGIGILVSDDDGGFHSIILLSDVRR